MQEVVRSRAEEPEAAELAEAAEVRPVPPSPPALARRPQERAVRVPQVQDRQVHALSGGPLTARAQVRVQPARWGRRSTGPSEWSSRAPS